MQHPNHEALIALANEKPVQWWNQHDCRWMDWKKEDTITKQINPVISTHCKWRATPEPRPDTHTYLTVRSGFTGNQTDVRFNSDNVKFTWRWNESTERRELAKAEVLF